MKKKRIIKYRLSEMKWFYNRKENEKPSDPNFLTMVQSSCESTLKVWYTRFFTLQILTIILLLLTVLLFVFDFHLLSYALFFLTLVAIFGVVYYRNRWRFYNHTGTLSCLAIATAVQQMEKEGQEQINE